MSAGRCPSVIRLVTQLVGDENEYREFTYMDLLSNKKWERPENIHLNISYIKRHWTNKWNHNIKSLSELLIST